jgi:colanic acid biosynthesis glycosyl transferase WcaI
MRVLFLNQYFPPDPAPTGILFREIADDLTRLGHDVDFVDAGQDYRAAQGRGGRMKRELAALRRMLAEGKSRPRADVVVSGTSPPCLAVIADRVARRHRARHFHWAMDVYPEIAIELGEIGRGSLVGKITGWMIGRAYRRCARVIALDADMAVRLRRHSIETELIRPWVFAGILGHTPAEIQPDEEWTWIYSGNLGRAHEWETLLQAQQRLEQRGAEARLLFQGGGPSFPLAKLRAAELGLRRCEFRDYVPDAELRTSLLRCHALAVTQLPSVQGLLWPSKLGLVMTLPRPILFVGPPEGAIAAALREFPHAGIFAPGDAGGVAAWLEAQRNQTAAIHRTLDAQAHRDESLAAWRRLISP